MIEYTFEYMDDGDNKWHRSRKRWASMDDAASYAKYWLEISFENDVSVAVRLVRLVSDN